MMASIEDMFVVINQAIDYAFRQEKYTLNFYDYLQGENFKKDEIDSFFQSTLVVAIKDQVEEIDMYLDGGETAAFVREAYSWMGKPRARKIRDYLNKILEDAKTYEQSKRRGRKPGSKNKKKPETSTK